MQALHFCIGKAFVRVRADIVLPYQLMAIYSVGFASLAMINMNVDQLIS